MFLNEAAFFGKGECVDSIDKFKDSEGRISRENIMKIIPYNEHFLFIDEVVSLDKKRIVARKKITGKEDFLKGHFVDFPITPGALIVEGLGQAATLLARYSIPNHQKKDVLAYKIRDAKFMAPVLPGSEMTYEVVSQGQMEKFAMMQGKVFVDGNLTAEAFMMLAIVDRDAFRGKHSSAK